MQRLVAHGYIASHSSFLFYFLLLLLRVPIGSLLCLV